MVLFFFSLPSSIFFLFFRWLANIAKTLCNGKRQVLGLVHERFDDLHSKLRPTSVSGFSSDGSIGKERKETTSNAHFSSLQRKTRELQAVEMYPLLPMLSILASRGRPVSMAQRVEDRDVFFSSLFSLLFSLSRSFPTNLSSVTAPQLFINPTSVCSHHTRQHLSPLPADIDALESDDWLAEFHKVWPSEPVV